MIFTSIVGIVMLVGLAFLLGFRRNPELDDSTARSLAEAALPGFVAAVSTVDATARTATVIARDGRVATVRPHGDRWVVRL